MSEQKTIVKARRRSRIFPQIQWSSEKIARWKAEQEKLYQRCKPIFESLKPTYIHSHYNWYLAIEPNSGDYFIAENELEAIDLSNQKYPNAPVHIFRINETGVAGTI